ncbi:hypothetical protein SAMN05660662_3145 [Blastococcus aurantiacus]|uniref:Uncharacterized protein n=1 Tax=Blastococcus aurantiacus TaxID=1550231 RepID=A0A1G7NIC6_9ACTN|nr:hypothetical protein [Blastococcus aurantiacus]SDF73059.1 hypothetical protein SAMN05660662_3145 [Blastococcus aurantiacus]
MTSVNRLPAALLAAVVAMSAAGCADAEAEAGAPGSVAGEGPTRPAAGGEDLVVDALPLEAPVVLDPVPEGLLLTGLSSGPPPGGDGFEPARATLYGDPELADTLDGPVLLVGTTSGSASLAGPQEGSAGEREVDLGGRTGRVVRDSDRTWVLIDGNDYREFVVGRGIGEDELITAARGADFASPTATLAEDAVPAGLEPLVAGSPQDGPYSSGVGLSMSLQGDQTWISVSAVRADPRLAALWGFWVEDATGTELRGSVGSAGNLQDANVGGSEARGRVWAEDGTVFSVVMDGPEDADEVLDQVVANLRAGTPAEAEELDRQVRERPPTAIESPCPADGGFVSGVEGASRWVFSLQPNTVSSTGEWSACYFDIPNSGGGGSVLPPPLGELALSGFGSGVVGGVAPPGTARVTVTDAGGVTRDAVLADDGPRPGERVWGTYIPLFPPPTSGAPFTVTAYDAAGVVLDSKVG